MSKLDPGVPTVVVHFNESGWPTYYPTDGARLLVIDERTPDDRVYDFRSFVSHEELDQLVGDSRIGSSDDEHLNRKVEAGLKQLIHGSHLTVVSTEDTP